MSVSQRVWRANKPRESSGLTQLEGQGNRDRPRYHHFARRIRSTTVCLSLLPGIPSLLSELNREFPLRTIGTSMEVVGRGVGHEKGGSEGKVNHACASSRGRLGSDCHNLLQCHMAASMIMHMGDENRLVITPH